jgi:hypothetical protein
MGECTNGVSVSIDGKTLSMTPETVETLFYREALEVKPA